MHAHQSFARGAPVGAKGWLGALALAQIVLPEELDVPQVIDVLHRAVEARGIERRPLAQVLDLAPQQAIETRFG